MRKVNFLTITAICIAVFFSITYSRADSVDDSKNIRDSIVEISKSYKIIEDNNQEINKHIRQIDLRFDSLTEKFAQIDHRLGQQNFDYKPMTSRFDLITKLLIGIIALLILILGFVLWDRFKRQTIVREEVFMLMKEDRELIKKLANGLIEYSETEPDLEEILKKEKIKDQLNTLKI